MPYLHTPIEALSGVGTARKAAYNRLGIYTAEDLLYHFPRAYEHRGDIRMLADARSEAYRGCIFSSAEASTAVFPAMMPPLALMTFCVTSKTAMVMLNVFVINMTATKVLNTHLKNVHVSKFARLLWSIII